MVIPPLIGNPYNGYINPYYWVDDHPLLYGNNWSLDPSTYHQLRLVSSKIRHNFFEVLTAWWDHWSMDTKITDPKTYIALENGGSVETEVPSGKHHFWGLC